MLLKHTIHTVSPGLDCRLQARIPAFSKGHFQTLAEMVFEL